MCETTRGPYVRTVIFGKCAAKGDFAYSFVARSRFAFGFGLLGQVSATLASPLLACALRLRCDWVGQNGGNCQFREKTSIGALVC